ASYQEAAQELESGHRGPWARHKARRQLSEASDRFDIAKQAWEDRVQPCAHQLAAAREQLSGQVAELEQAQQARTTFLVEHPDVPQRLVVLNEAIKHEQALQRRHSFQRILQRGQAQALGNSHESDAGMGIGM
ncbi:MAG TPA: hypothetical protein VEJ84_04395, partial [Acidimicrobiales bacterium]|nr:hypothetical protein [Acidimicrobiales bacterium]